MYKRQLHIDGTTEPFETIIGTHVCLAILYRCPVSYTVEGDTVGFVLFVEGKSGVLYTNIPQCTGIVGVIIATIGCAAYFRATRSAFGIGVCVSADVDTAPCAWFFFSEVITIGLLAVPCASILAPCSMRM